MKSLAFALICTCALSAQPLKPLIPNSPVIIGKTNMFKKTVFTISPNVLNSEPAFFAYNPILGTTDNIGGSFAHANARLTVENMHRGVKIDSFNPNGASNFNEGIISGALNLIFNGNTGKSAFLRL